MLWRCCVCLCAVALFAERVDAKKALPVRPVRKLLLKPDPKARPDIGRDQGTTVLATRDELVKALGEARADELLKQLNIKTESVVRIDWGTSGPPFGVLEFRIEPAEKGPPAVTFFVREPNVQIRGQAFKIGMDVYAVPAGSKVTFGKP